MLHVVSTSLTESIQERSTTRYSLRSTCRSTRFYRYCISCEDLWCSKVWEKKLYIHQRIWIWGSHLSPTSYQRKESKTCWSPSDTERKGQHNCCIRNFNGLMGDQNDDNNQYFYCHYCLHGFTKRCLLKRHVLYCQLHGAQRTEMPADDDKC